MDFVWCWVWTQSNKYLFSCVSLALVNLSVIVVLFVCLLARSQRLQLQGEGNIFASCLPYCCHVFTMEGCWQMLKNCAWMMSSKSLTYKMCFLKEKLPQHYAAGSSCLSCVCVSEWHFHRCIASLWAVTPCTLCYCSLSCWAPAPYSNPEERKKQIKKAKSQLFLLSLWNTPSFCQWMPTFVWSDEIDCVNSECSAKVLMDVEKGNFQWQSTVD